MGKTVSKIIPENFLCTFPLHVGAIASAVVFIVVTIICCAALIAQVVLMKNCIECPRFVWDNAYSFSIIGVIYCIAMLVLHVWLIFGVKKKKTSVLLSWVVITTMWLMQTFFLLITLIGIHSGEVNFVAWILSLVFGLLAIGILAYLVLVVLALWREIKAERKRQADTRDTN